MRDDLCLIALLRKGINNTKRIYYIARSEGDGATNQSGTAEIHAVNPSYPLNQCN